MRTFCALVLVCASGCIPFIQKRLDDEEAAWVAYEKREKARTLEAAQRKAARRAYCKSNPQDCRVLYTECSSTPWTSSCRTYWR